MQSIRLQEKDLRDYLLGSLHYCGTRWQGSPKVFAEALASYRQITGQGLYHLPFFLLMDLHLLLRNGYQTPFSSDQGYTDWSEEERALRLRYENEILGRLLQESGIQEALELLEIHKFNPNQVPTQQENGELSQALKNTATAYQERFDRLLFLCTRALAKHFPKYVTLNPAFLRLFTIESQAAIDVDKHFENFMALVDTPDFYLQMLQEFLNNVTQKFQWSELIKEEDMFELQHWEVLDREALRIGCRQLLELERKLGEVDIRRVAIANEDSETESAFVDETHYPTGGLAGLTNRGSFENLVLSELVYMESGQDIDLFDVRYLEGELLYYMRDAGLLRRKRRTIHIIYDLGEAFQTKSRGYKYPFCTLFQGFGLRLVRDLFKVFEDDAVEIHFHYLYKKAKKKEVHPEIDILQPEMELMQLLLSDHIQHQRVHFHLRHEMDFEALKDPTRKVYAIVFCEQKRKFWLENLEKQKQERPPLLGLTVALSTSKQLTTAGKKTPKTTKSSSKKSEPRYNAALLQVPKEGLSFAELVQLKDQIISELAGLRLS